MYLHVQRGLAQGFPEGVGGRIKIRATYTIPVELPGYTYYWDFEHIIDRPVFIV